MATTCVIVILLVSVSFAVENHISIPRSTNASNEFSDELLLSLAHDDDTETGRFRYDGWNWMNLLSRDSSCERPPNFPQDIEVAQKDFLNWSEELKLGTYWTAAPKNPHEVVTLANWARENNFRIRPRGFMHSWAPITLTSTSRCTKTILVDTTKYLNKIWLTGQGRDDTDEVETVTAHTGASWEDLLQFLEQEGYGIFSYPAVGKMTLGGTLAVGAHGTGLPVRGTKAKKGFKTGSISNLITSLDAVVWDAPRNAYALRRFNRKHPDTRAFMVHLGRAFITQVTLQIGKNYNLRCRSVTNIPAGTLLGPNANGTNSLAIFVEQYDRVEAQYFPYTDKTWLKLWTEEEVRSAESQMIRNPYPYTHGNQVLRPVDRLITLLAVGVTRVTPIISRMTYELGVSGVSLTRTSDVWGPSKNSLLYYHTLSHKFISLGYTVLTTRANIQRVVHTCYSFFDQLTTKMATHSKWPMNQPVEFRVTGLDKTDADGVRPPSLSFLREVEGHPEYDVAVFLGLHYFPGTRYSAEFMRDWESFLFSTFAGQYGTARVEWAKTWGFDTTGPWVNETVYKDILPYRFGAEWNWAVNKLTDYDPHHIFTNEFLNKLMTPTDPLRYY